MLKGIRFTTEINTTLSLYLDPLAIVANPSAAYIREVEGLGPVKGEIVGSSYGSNDGGVYQNSRVGERNVVVKLGVNPDFTFDDPYGRLRRSLYQYFSPKQPLTMYFMSDNFEEVTLTGYVESFEPSIFSQEPEMTLSIICYDPYFYSRVFSTASITGTGTISIDNPGTNTGFIATVMNFYSSGSFGLRLLPNWSNRTRLATTSPLVVSGSTLGALQIDTRVGRKYARLRAASGYTPPGTLSGTNVLGAIDGWPELYTGVNDIYVDVAASNTPNATTYIRYQPRYVGL